MKAILYVLLLMGLSSTANAMTCNAAGSYCSNVVVTKILVRDNGQILIGVEGSITNSCSYHGHSIRIETNNGTDADNPMVSALLTFLSQKKKIHFGLKVTPANLQGTNETNGCTTTSPSRIRNVRASFNPDDFGSDEIISAEDENIP